MSLEAQIRPINILLVDDSETDVLLTREALADAKIRNHMDVVHDGEEALKFLRQQDPYKNKTRPDLVLLDLNMPKKDGREVLKEIKSDPKLKTLPVVILTTSKAEEDIARSYAYHANCYVTKPVDYEQFSVVVRSIESFWLSVVTFPPHL
ncbi:MAG: response regulator [Verrucomicrobiota bacterium JB022]|nr:response regulator [Verrucomicrobiota bacterium JB022]